MNHLVHSSTQLSGRLSVHWPVCPTASPLPPGCRAMAPGRGATVGVVLLGLGLVLAIIVPAVILSRHHNPCSPQAFAHAAVAADSKVCSDIGR